VPGEEANRRGDADGLRPDKVETRASGPPPGGRGRGDTPEGPRGSRGVWNLGKGGDLGGFWSRIVVPGFRLGRPLFPARQALPPRLPIDSFPMFPLASLGRRWGQVEWWATSFPRQVGNLSPQGCRATQAGRGQVRIRASERWQSG
jgi:hypothetical protein